MGTTFNPFTGTIDFTGAKGRPNAGVVYASDHGDDLWAAIAATPAGGTLVLEAKRYVGSPAVSFAAQERHDITIMGAKMPRYADDNNSLVDGTIIEGGFLLGGSNLHMANLGVDCGPTWRATPGAQTVNCFSIVNQSGGWKNVSLTNCIALQESATAATHCLVLVGVENVDIENIKAQGSLWGLVLKTKRTRVHGLRTFNVGRSGLHIKSAPGYPIEDIVCSDIQVESTSVDLQDGGIGIYILTDLESIYNVAISNASVIGYRTGLTNTCDAGYTINNVVINNVNIDKATFLGMNTNGAAGSAGHNGLQVSNVNVTLTTGRCFDFDGVNMNLANLHGNDSAFQANAITITGNYMAQNISSTFGGVSSNLGGITAEPNAALGGGQLGLYKGVLVTNPV